jgi:hypothetical protein
MKGLKPIKKTVDLSELVKVAQEFDDSYLDVTVRAIDLYDKGDVSDLVSKYLKKSGIAEFAATNIHSKRLFLTALLRSFIRAKVKSKRKGRLSLMKAVDDAVVACALVTLTDRGWACADCNIEFDLEKAKRKVRNALRGNDFVGRFEPAIYRNEEWKNGGKAGRLISFHCHAIVWASSRPKLDRLRAEIRPRFEPILGNKNGARFDARKTFGDVLETTCYVAKMPYLGTRTVGDAEGRRTQKPTKKISFRSRWHLFNAMKDRTVFEYWLSGGQGVKILRRAKKATKAEVPRKKVSDKLSKKFRGRRKR